MLRVACRTRQSRFLDIEGRYPVDLSLYLVTHRPSVTDDATFIDKVIQGVRGGVTCVQLRECDRDRSSSFKRAMALKEKLRLLGIPLIINDHIEVVLAAQAEGIHLGQNDFPCYEARRLLGPQAIIGLTVNRWADVVEAEKWDIDYLGVQVFPSRYTKPESLTEWGVEGVRKIRAFSRHRIVTIGGLTLENLSPVYQELNQQGDGIAMVGELWRSHDPASVAKQIRALFHRLAMEHGSFHAPL